MGKQAIVLFAMAIATALFMLGCGGSSTSISKAEFTKKAEAACKKGEESIRKDFKVFATKYGSAKKPTKAELAALANAVFSGTIEAEVRELQAIDIPSGDEEQVEALIAAREESLKGVEAEPEEAIADSKKVFGKASRLAKEYGLEACSQR